MPSASTLVTARPASRSGQRSRAARGWGVRIASGTCPCSTGRIRCAAWWMVSPSGMRCGNAPGQGTLRTMVADLARIVGAAHVLPGDDPRYVADQTAFSSVHGSADAVVLPADAEQVAAVVSWCHERGVAVVPRGGGTGWAGGAVPLGTGVVVGLERLSAVHAVDPLQWRMTVGAGVTTATVQRLARENGLCFPPDPGAAETSQIGGNVATNAGGPHCFKYGVTGAWVTGVEAVLASGEIVRVGGVGAQGRRGLRPARAARRLRGHARGDHGRLAAADPRARGLVAGRGVLSGGRGRRRRGRAADGGRPGARGDRVPRRGGARARGRGVPRRRSGRRRVPAHHRERHRPAGRGRAGGGARGGRGRRGARRRRPGGPLALA